MGNGSVIEALVSGSISSTFTTVLYQPLELLKTRLQLKNGTQVSTNQIFGKATSSTVRLIKENGLFYLWRGTGPSLMRSIPGVGLYFGSLNLLQTNFSQQENRPDNSTQAFYFALISRSMVSFILLPITVVKVRYESGLYKYPNLFDALLNAYHTRAWIAVSPTLLRDALFSGIYYMFYTKLKSYVEDSDNPNTQQEVQFLNNISHSKTFLCGIVGGLAAAIVTNPMDVVKTRMQINHSTESLSVKKTFFGILEEKNGMLRLYDGLVPRSIRRTLIAATTWTFFEYSMDKLKRKNNIRSQ